MQAFGHTVLAWSWLELHLASTGTAAAHVGRRQACQFFYHYELTKIGAWLQVVSTQDATCAHMPENAF
jgi:butyryl-CoA dehydrogenase